MEVRWENEFKWIQTVSKVRASGEKNYGCC